MLKALESGALMMAFDGVVPMLQQVYYFAEQFDTGINMPDKANFTESNVQSTLLLFQYLSLLCSKIELNQKC